MFKAQAYELVKPNFNFSSFLGAEARLSVWLALKPVFHAFFAVSQRAAFLGENRLGNLSKKPSQFRSRLRLQYSLENFNLAKIAPVNFSGARELFLNSCFRSLFVLFSKPLTFDVNCTGRILMHTHRIR